MIEMSAKKGWNIISRSYQEETRISLEDVHYGPISPGESELKLLGKVKDKDALEIGCGGGQNAIVLSKWGARSMGLDISEEQIIARANHGANGVIRTSVLKTGLISFVFEESIREGVFIS